MKSLNLYLISFIVIISVIIINVNGIITFEQDVTLTLKEKEKLQQFKNRVHSRLPHAYKTDLYLLKWLRTSYFNLKDAERRLIENLAWRKENNIDNILLEDFSDIQDEFHYNNNGRDKYGRPYAYIHIMDMDLRKIILQGRLERLERYKDYAIEKGCNLVRELGEKYGNITRGGLIVNVDGFNVLQHACLRCIPFLINIVTAYQLHYPECVDQYIFLNTPAIAEPLVNIGLPLITKELRESLKIYGTNKKQWIKEILNDFEPSQLPPELGGTNEELH